MRFDLHDVLGLLGWGLLGTSIYVELGPWGGIGYIGGTILMVSLVMAWNDSQ